MHPIHPIENSSGRKRQLRRWILLLAVVLTLLLILFWRNSAKGDPDVILISMDTTRADHFGCYGNKWIKTPNVDALAGDSILFTNYLTVVPSTLASHVSLFTGKYPHHHGISSNGFIMNDANKTMAQILKAHGYRTAGFIGSFSLDSRFHVDAGFDYYDQKMDIEVGHLGADQEQRRASAVTDSVIHYLESDKSGGKSFLFVHYFDPHQPYDPPPEFASLYDNVGAPSPQSVNPDCCGYLHRDDNDPKRGNWPRLYAAEITYMDSEIGRLLDYLKSRGSYKNSIIILTSDHGEILWEHEPVFSHGRNVYESVIHTVCMIKLPGRKFRGTKCDRLSANIDVLPTLLHELRIPPPQGMDGEVLALDGTAGVRPESPRFSEATQPLNDIDIDPKWTNKTKTKCIRLGRYKYVMTPYAHTEEFYDLSADPCEQENLIQRPGALAETMNDLRSRLQALNEQAAPLETHFERIQLEETVAKLTKLGYLEASSTAATSGTLPGHD